MLWHLQGWAKFYTLFLQLSKLLHQFSKIRKGNIKGNKAACLANPGKLPWPAGSCSHHIPGFTGCSVKVLQSSVIAWRHRRFSKKSVADTTTMTFMNLWSLENTSSGILLCAIHQEWVATSGRISCLWETLMRWLKCKIPVLDWIFYSYWEG